MGVIDLDAAALAAYPGPAAVFDSSHTIVAANDRAEALRSAFALGKLPTLAEMIRRGGGQSQVVTEALANPDGTESITEFTALPAAGGKVLVLGRDVTLERNLRSVLVESRQRYKDLVDISSDFAWEVGSERKFVFVSPKGAMGFSAEELVGAVPDTFLLRHDGNPGASPFTTGVSIADVEVWMRQADGGEACFLTSARPIRDDDGNWAGARGVCRDVTQERLRDAALLRANNRERLLSYIVRTIRDELEPADMLRAAAEATARVLGATGCQIFRILPEASDFALAAQYGGAGDEKPILDSFIGSDHYEADGDGWRVLASVTRHRHSINGALCVWRSLDRPAWSDDDRLLMDDVANQVGLANEQIANHERILRLSRTDSLTGLYNRRAFFEEIARRYQRLAREHRPAALIYCDLDNFKWVNDVHGHQVGDQALLAVRDMLSRNTRPQDLVARLGGDEFAIWLDGAGEQTVRQRCQSLMDGANELDHFSGSPDRPLHMSLGVAVHSGDSGESLEDLLARADRAMYEVKRDGKGAWRLSLPTKAGGG